MAKQNTRQEVQERINNMQEKKVQDLLNIQIKLDEARTQREAADLAIKEATENMNLEAYEEAVDRKHKAQAAIDMYSGRYKQIEAKEYVAEEESDRVIDSLLAYEEEITAKFEEDIKAPLKTLEKLQADYEQEIEATETTMRTWQRDIHANYNTRGAASFYDKETGEHTHRSKKPVPVHRGYYEGSGAGVIIQEMLNGKLSEYVKG